MHPAQVRRWVRFSEETENCHQSDANNGISRACHFTTGETIKKKSAIRRRHIRPSLHKIKVYLHEYKLIYVSCRLQLDVKILEQKTDFTQLQFIKGRTHNLQHVLQK